MCLLNKLTASEQTPRGHVLAIPSSSITDLPLRPPHLRRLLPPQGDLRRHDALPLHHQQAAVAAAVPPAAEAFVAFQTRHDAVVAAAGAFGAAGHLAGRRLVALGSRVRSVAPSVPAADARRGASVRARRVFGFECVRSCRGLQLRACFQLRGHL